MYRENIFPDSHRLLELTEDIKTIIAQVPAVSRICVFGSLARNDWDRWSDIDMIVITQTQRQFLEVWKAVHAVKPILYHHPLSKAAPSGVHALGNVFAGESIFHCVDLNFLTIQEYETAGAMERFKTYTELYQAQISPLANDEDISNVLQSQSPDEEQIAIGIHFAKKHIKKILRGVSDYHVLKESADYLNTVMQNYSADYEIIGSGIGKVARTYLAIATHLLENRPFESETALQ